MATMKYPNGGGNMAVSSGNAPNVDEVESLFTSQCWPSGPGGMGDFMDNPHSLSLDGPMGGLSADKLLLDDSDLEKLFLQQQPGGGSLAELKPLPPFTGYTANLSINGIPGHHYHTISQRVPEENNNYNYGEQNIVSSSTCANNNNHPDTTLEGYSDSVVSNTSAKMYDCADSAGANIKTEMAEYDTFDFANIIGSAMADTTVPSAPEDDHHASRDSWIDFESLIDGACGDQKSPNLILSTQDGLSEFVIQQPQAQQQGSTLQTLLTHGYMPLLQNRLQNGPPIKQEVPSSTYGGRDLISTSSPPSSNNVVSTTENLILNGRFMSSSTPSSQYLMDTDGHRMRSPDMLGGQNYPHTTTSSTPSKKSRNRAQKKQAASSTTSTSSVFQEQNLGLLGKEKPVHRCNICNRGFLNKSNIKVHLRTHTGEKPFRCDTCAKAFRQKAHLLKHQQIHKRIGRD